MVICNVVILQKLTKKEKDRGAIQDILYYTSVPIMAVDIESIKRKVMRDYYQSSGKVSSDALDLDRIEFYISTFQRA